MNENINLIVTRQILFFGKNCNWIGGVYKCVKCKINNENYNEIIVKTIRNTVAKMHPFEVIDYKEAR